MRSRDVTILIIPGLGNSGPDHWQSRWQAKLPTARRVEQASWEKPEHGPWLEAIRAALADDARPVVAIAHSLGVIALAEALLGAGDVPLAGAFLVAPPSQAAILEIPEIDPGFAPYPVVPLPCPSVMVGSRNDPYARPQDTEGLALDWGSRFIDAGEAGHINAASGHGPWPEGLMAFAGFLNKL
jgi:predicted alpha/beta hydrolase family esterase